jgi:hypothetical protein
LPAAAWILANAAHFPAISAVFAPASISGWPIEQIVQDRRRSRGKSLDR